MRDPFDGAVVVCVLATLCFAALIVALGFTEAVHVVISVWPLVSGAALLAWLLVAVVAPVSGEPVSSRPRQLLVLAVYVALHGAAAAPVVALAWELGGPRIVIGAVLATGMCGAAFTVYAIAKPTIELDPVDPFVVLAVLTGTTILVSLGLHLPLRFAWGSAAIWLSGIFILRDISDVFAYVTRGRRLAGGTRLFTCAAVLFTELTIHFTMLTIASD